MAGWKSYFSGSFSCPARPSSTWPSTAQPSKALLSQLLLGYDSLHFQGRVSTAASPQPENCPGQELAALFLVWRPPCSTAPFSNTAHPGYSHDTIKIVKNFKLNSTCFKNNVTTASNSKFYGLIRHVLYFFQSLFSYA